MNSDKLPSYSEGHIMGCEYVTRAYNILYDVEHGAELEACLAKERKAGFIYINEIYQMILELEQ